ncbi:MULTISPECIES: SPL family radical SAM protein [Neomoorella]|uniref:Radical SAM superfamily protein n=1 Tax=Neomoorella thermoacetica TaxID=1525 RepID=A0A1J5JLJ0_NEOTH|nr:MULTISPECIES: radical SAM protein [Moorella]OIQ07642.1 radical SAM superfamily protein [Moorella thermoacetica]OIQ10406.1 radical SAM superfamily protein [Moorella thermoacetica]BCV22540.1 radical SAM protein [Moorella sp. Hama-1]
MFKLYETACRSALNRSRIPGLDYCLNPYTGCSHGCIYCYASCMARFSGRREKWGSFVQVKTNFVEVLAAQLRRPKKGKVMLASVTDAYQAIERKYSLTRRCLELLTRSGLEASILTKSDLVLRDVELLKAMPHTEVGFTITTLDDKLAGVLEPGAPSTSRRLAALEKLAGAGIRTWVFVAPVIPGLTDAPEDLTAITKAATRAGAQEVDFDPLNFYPAAVSIIRELISRYWPRAKSAFDHACRHPAAYRQLLREIIKHSESC